MGKLAWYKLVNGLSLERLGAKMERGPEQFGGLVEWEALPLSAKPGRNRDVFVASHPGAGCCPVNRGNLAGG